MSKTFGEALAEIQSWVGTVDGVVIVGEGEIDGESTIDVWVIPAQLHRPIPERQDSFRVVVRDSGGEIIALERRNGEASES